MAIHELLKTSDVNQKYESAQYNPEGPYNFDYLPVDYSVGQEPSNPLQREILRRLEEHITGDGLKGQRVPLPTREIPYNLQSKPNLVMMFGNGELNSPTNTLYLHRKVFPRPTPLFLLVNNVPKFPDFNFITARQQNFLAACHNGVVFEGDQNDTHIKRALWVSTQGNYYVIESLEGSEDEIYINVARRIQEHYGAAFVKTRYDMEDTEEPIISWDQWRRLPAHRELAKAAQILGKYGIIEDEVYLGDLTDNEAYARAVRQAFNKNGLGESMRSMFDPQTGLMLVTRSGGGKVNLSSVPSNGHLVPIHQLTPDGYVVAKIEGCAIIYDNGSVEGHENGMVYKASSDARNGVKTFEQFVDITNAQFKLSPTGRINIVSKNSPSPAILVLDHSHSQTRRVNREKVRVASPDRRYFPEIDLPCGSRRGALALISAFYQVPEFVEGKELGDLVIVVELDGHGMVVAGGDREVVTNAILNEMELQPPKRV